MNKVMLIGHLGADPEVRYTQGGSPVCNLRIATDESYTDREGKRVDRTEWHRVIVFQRQAENCAKYLGKGSLVFVEGKLTTRKWQDQSGQDRYTTEIRADRVEFLGRRGDGSQGASAGMGGMNDDGGYRAAPPRAQAPRQDNYGSDSGSPFPSEAPYLDDVPF
jgi:single-strand DNA-binding protein